MIFSVIIPVYNVERYICDCLDSVLNQSFDEWEAVCVNDGSTDNSAAILTEYADKDRRIHVVSQPNGGLSAARNAGLAAAQGDYILFLDGDDWLESNALESLSKQLGGEDILCFSGRRFVEESGTFNLEDQLPEKTYATGMAYYNENALLHRDFAFVCVVLRAYRRSFLQDSQLVFKEGIFHEDNLFTPKACFYARRVRVINACLYNYRVRANSITTTWDLKHLDDMMVIANELAAFFVAMKGFDKKVVYRAITHHYQVVFVSASEKEIKGLGRRCNWQLYRQVSRTKLRHRLNYVRFRIQCVSWKNR